MLSKMYLRQINNQFQRTRFSTSKNLTRNTNKEEFQVFQYAKEGPNRRIYGWGFAESGALGLKSKQIFIQALKNPVRLSFGEKHEVTDVACGFGFTVYAVKQKNKIYGSGMNTDSQIGQNVMLGKHTLNLMETPAPVALVPDSENLTVLNVSAGRAHVMVLTSNGLFTLGNNAYGQCGRTIVSDESYSQRCLIHYIPKINDQKITGIQCGQDHSLIISEKGEVYGCGWSADGQTGLGHFEAESTFSRVLGDIEGEIITKVACTADCVLALNDKGEIFGWGNSEYGQLGNNSDSQQINLPIHLKHNIGKVVDIAAGGSFCMALNESGNIYVWGYGLLGSGHGIQQSFTPVIIPPTFFYNCFQPDAKVVSICCGIGHMGAVTNVGDFYTWGKNRQGCLGLGHLNNQHFPLKVAIGASVQKVACGLDHTIALCKSFV